MAESIRFTDKYVDPSGIGSADRQGLFNLIYPVGSIYMSVNSASPATLFGGTWERIQERFLLGCGSVHAAGVTGGERYHTLTVDEMPSHHHTPHGIGTPNGDYSGLPGGGLSGWAVASDSANNNNIYRSKAISTGGSQAHNNMPPYLAVYIWKRTA